MSMGLQDAVLLQTDQIYAVGFAPRLSLLFAAVQVP
jgi:hypothetical protein